MANLMPPTLCAPGSSVNWAGMHVYQSIWKKSRWRRLDERHDVQRHRNGTGTRIRGVRTHDVPPCPPGDTMSLHSPCCTAEQLGDGRRHRVEELAAAYRQADPEFAHWAAGYGVIKHDPLTQLRVREMVAELV